MTVRDLLDKIKSLDEEILIANFEDDSIPFSVCEAVMTEQGLILVPNED